MKYIDEATIAHKTVLVRVDFNVSLNPNNSIADDARIKQALPTLEYLLKHHNKLILIAHLGEPEKRNPADSLTRIAKRLQEYLPHNKIHFVEDFTTPTHAFLEQKENEIILLENIRFYPGETKNDPLFTKHLATLGEIYVDDAFSVCHRKHTSIVGLPTLLPSYGGLLLKKEVIYLSEIIKNPKKPYVAIIGGKKITTKIKFISKLASLADSILLGGGLANTFLAALGYKIGKSIVAKEEIDVAKQLLSLAKKEKRTILLPKDVVVGKSTESKQSEIKKIDHIEKDDRVLDIGPETQADFGAIIEQAKTIVWNGPMGVFEMPAFAKGTLDIAKAVAAATTAGATSIVGGGDSVAAVHQSGVSSKISHISTGGGASLEFLGGAKLPGVEALTNK